MGCPIGSLFKENFNPFPGYEKIWKNSLFIDEIKILQVVLSIARTMLEAKKGKRKCKVALKICHKIFYFSPFTFESTGNKNVPIHGKEIKVVRLMVKL